MIEGWAVSEVYAAESAVMAGLAEGELMARAVAGLAEVAAARLREQDGDRVVALVGPGNNGGDALYAAAELAERGFNVAAVHLEAVHEGAHEAAVAAGVLLSVGSDPVGLHRITEADIVLDGIVGIGGRPGLPEFAGEWLAAVPDTAYLIAVDLPSGQDPAGHILDPDGVFADETVTFSLVKPVHLLPPTEAACGRLTVIDIGIGLDDLPGGSEPTVRRLDHDDVVDLWPVPGVGDDKYSRGVLGVIAGGENYSGAAVLAVTAAVGAGVGMVRYVGTATPERLVRAAVPEAVHGVGRVDGWVIGPGLEAETIGTDRRAAVADALASELPVLVDAGGLDLLTTGVLAARRGRPTLLTPHAGECARLLTRLRDPEPRRARYVPEVTATHVRAEPVHHARALAELTGAHVLLKGSTTVIAPPDPDQPVWSQADGPVWLATAGTGDVLAGLVSALLATGVEPAMAGALGTLVHGVAADRANPGGPLRALAVAHAIPAAVAHLLNR